MSYTCWQHGWQHLLNPCPACGGKTMASSSITPGIVGVYSGHYESLKQEVASLKAKLAVAVEALEEIAGKDFRGNRPHEQTLAFKALAKLKETL